MTQLLPSTGVNLQEVFRALVYQSIVAPAEGATAPRRGSDAADRREGL